MTTIFRYHWTKNYLCNYAGAEITSPNDLPRLFAGNPEEVIAFQFVQASSEGGIEPYTGISAAATCNFRADNDHANSPIAVGSSDWTAGSGFEFFKTTTAVKPDVVYINDVPAAEGEIGSLAAGEYGFIGKYLYVRLDDDGDPTAKANNYVSIVYGSSSYTPPFASVESDQWNLPGTWPEFVEGEWTTRDPDITQGECTFSLSANTFQLAARLGQTKSIQINGQIGIFDVTRTDYKVMSNSFGIYNVINPAGPPVETESPWLTVSMGDARYLDSIPALFKADIDWTTAGNTDVVVPANFVLTEFRAFGHTDGSAIDLDGLEYNVGVPAEEDKFIANATPPEDGKVTYALDDIVGGTTLRVQIINPSTEDGATGRIHFQGYTI